MPFRKLQEAVDKRLKLSDMPDSRRFRNTQGTLQPENKKLADAVLAEFTELNHSRLLQEERRLSTGTGTVSDSAVPASFEYAVIREAFYNLVGIQFLNVEAATFTESHFIPYSYRKNAASIDDNITRTYEGGSINQAGLTQAGETAYPIPQKLSFEVTDELRYVTSNEQLNYEVVSENQKNAARIISEDLDRLIFNEQVHAADEYQTIQISNEDLAQHGKKVALVGGTQVTTVCRPRSVFNLQGEQVGNTANPITVEFDGVAIEEFKTSVTTPAPYYVLDYDIGEIYLVDASGALFDPTGKTWTISYSKATNVTYFDVDVPTGRKDKEHWDGFLRVYALRKSLIEDTRLYQANFGLMSGNTMIQIEQAEKFGANHRVPGTLLNETGNLGMIKNTPNFKTAAPGLWLGDRRVVIGEQGVTRLRITKPWQMGRLENKRDANGRFTGEKEAYGDQFIILHTPKFLKAALTSIVLYSASTRVARDQL